MGGHIAVEELLHCRIFDDEDMFALLCTEVLPSHQIQFDEFCLLVLNRFAREGSQGEDLLRMLSKTGNSHPYIQKFGKIRSQLRSSDRFSSGPRTYLRDSAVPPQAAW